MGISVRGLGREKERRGADVFRWTGWSLIRDVCTKGSAEGFQNERRSKPGSDCIVSDRLECVVLVCPFAKSQRSQNKPLGHLEAAAKPFMYPCRISLIEFGKKSGTMMLPRVLQSLIVHGE